MPQLIEYIYVIAQQKQRDVLYVTFQSFQEFFDNDHKYKAKRRKFISWLNKHEIAWRGCSAQHRDIYFGEIYIDVPFDENNPQYKLVCNYLENPDGTLRDEKVQFYCLSLKAALEEIQYYATVDQENQDEHF